MCMYRVGMYVYVLCMHVCMCMYCVGIHACIYVRMYYVSMYSGTSIIRIVNYPNKP